MLEIRDCGECRFFQLTFENWYGECRRYPPVIVPGTTHAEGLWPGVLAEQTCGEFSS